MIIRRFFNLFRNNMKRLVSIIILFEYLIYVFDSHYRSFFLDRRPFERSCFNDLFSIRDIQTFKRWSDTLDNLVFGVPFVDQDLK